MEEKSIYNFGKGTFSKKANELPFEVKNKAMVTIERLSKEIGISTDIASFKDLKDDDVLDLAEGRYFLILIDFMWSTAPKTDSDSHYWNYQRKNVIEPIANMFEKSLELGFSMMFNFTEYWKKEYMNEYQA